MRYMKDNLVIAVVATLIISGGVGFFAGMKYQESKLPEFMRNMPSNFQTMRERFDQRVGNQGLRPLSGEILTINEGSITVKLPDESSKIVLLTESSVINKTEEGSNDDLSEGTQVVVFGQENSDGSVTAQNIQIGAEMFRKRFE
jgi:hypothetical protein